ncbi:YtxH domain-containing protein [Neobacillus mesonae]|uniref:YtxH domain-containing protein n=1 Tax=Neobacillus mesonae TaxID=1193713 RepID=UPI00203DA280|nr:YtxH domain-containing protein [Neobacillus mesonae]MCM3569204.1 YtxH domain-containing protein [Neobacillus mesonae]
MTKKNLFWKGMFLGALAGGAVSLFDRNTREVMKGNVQKASSKVYDTVKHPKETVTKIKSMIDEVSEDFAYLTDKVEEIRELTPQVTDIIKETKDTFTKDDDNELMEDLIERK